jgi:hypothetical protein
MRGALDLDVIHRDAHKGSGASRAARYERHAEPRFEQGDRRLPRGSGSRRTPARVIHRAIRRSSRSKCEPPTARFACGGGLGDIALLSSAREVERTRYREEVEDLMHFHGKCVPSRLAHARRNGRA